MSHPHTDTQAGDPKYFPRHERAGIICGVIYLHQISDVRLTETVAKSFKTFLAVCGDQALQNVVIATNMWGKVTPEVGAAREKELASEFFKLALDKGAMLRRHNGTAESAHSIIRDILGKEPVPLQIQEVADQWREIEETAAREELLRELQELQEALNQTEAGDEETRQELQREALKLRKRLVTLNGIPGGSMDNFHTIMKDVFFFGFLSAGIYLWLGVH